MNAVIFDMDGVLTDTEPCHVAAEKLLFKEFDIDLPTEYLQSFMGTSLVTIFNAIVKDYHIDTTLDYLIPKYEKYIASFYRENALLMPGAFDLVKSLFDLQIPLALASSSSHELISIVLDKFDINHYFQTVVSGHDVKHTKPEPDIFLKTAELLHVDPEKCLVIEDSANGVRAAKSAGMFCVGFKSPNSGNQDISSSDHIVSHLSELSVDFIQKLFD